MRESLPNTARKRQVNQRPGLISAERRTAVEGSQRSAQREASGHKPRASAVAYPNHHVVRAGLPGMRGTWHDSLSRGVGRMWRNPLREFSTVGFRCSPSCKRWDRRFHSRTSPGKDADPNIPVLQQVKVEFAKLKQSSHNTSLVSWGLLSCIQAIAEGVDY